MKYPLHCYRTLTQQLAGHLRDAYWLCEPQSARKEKAHFGGFGGNAHATNPRYSLIERYFVVLARSFLARQRASFLARNYLRRHEESNISEKLHRLA